MEKITFNISPLPFTFNIDPESIRSLEKFLTTQDDHLIELAILNELSRRIPIIHKTFNLHNEIKVSDILGCMFISMPKGISVYSLSIIRLPVIIHLLTSNDTSVQIPLVSNTQGINTRFLLATGHIKDAEKMSRHIIEDVKGKYNKIYTNHLIEYFENNPKTHCIRENGIREYTSPCGAVVRKVGDKCYVSKEYLYKTGKM